LHKPRNRARVFIEIDSLGRVATRETILTAVWGSVPTVEDNTLDAFPPAQSKDRLWRAC
jgi:DNA-binding response OmpR family regulator